MTTAKPGRLLIAVFAAALMGAGSTAHAENEIVTVKVDTSTGLDRLGDLSLDARKLDLRQRRVHQAAGPAFEEVMKFEAQSLRPSQVTRVVRKNIRRLQYCYADAAARSAAPTGVATMHFVVEPKGHVSKVSVVAEGVAGRRLERCMTRAIRRWRFPRADAETTVDYPLLFDVAGAAAQAK